MPKGVVDHANADNPNRLGKTIIKDSEPDENFTDTEVLIKEVSGDLSLPATMTAGEANIFVNLSAILGPKQHTELMHVMNSTVLSGWELTIRQTRNLIIQLRGKITGARHSLDLYWDEEYRHTGPSESIKTVDSALRSVQYLVMQITGKLFDFETNSLKAKNALPDGSIPSMSLDDIETQSRILERLGKTQSMFMDTLSGIRTKTSQILLSNTIKGFADEVGQTPAQTAHILSMFLQEHDIEPTIADTIASRFLSANPASR